MSFARGRQVITARGKDWRYPRTVAYLASLEQVLALLLPHNNDSRLQL